MKGKEETQEKKNLEMQSNCSIENNSFIKENKSATSHSDNSDCDSEKNIFIIDSTTNSPKKRNSIKDFEIIQMLGKGSYAKVVLAKNIYTKQFYSLKIIDKEFLGRLRKEYEVHIEKYMLSNLHHKNIVKLFSTFQDNRKLYFILEYCPNKDFTELIRRMGKLSLDLTKFYIAEIITALEYMHKKGIYHRDLKPENILLGENMHLKICDFGTANIKNMCFDKSMMKFVPKDDCTNNEDEEYEEDVKKAYDLKLDLVGTPEYVSPEILSRNLKEIGPPVDLWSLGCILFTCLHGFSPFKDKTDLITFDKILNKKYTLDENISEDAKDLIRRLLVKEPYKRIGSGENGSENDFRALKGHKFFNGIHWDKLHETEPPIDKESLNNPCEYKLISKENKSHSLTPIGTQSQLCIRNQNINSSYNKESFFKVKDCLNKEKEGEVNLILEGIVQKKSPWFHYHTRMLKLYSCLNIFKLEYYDPNQELTKGNIVLNKNSKAVYIDEYNFEVSTKNRKYYFKLNCNYAKNWVEKINSAIQSNIDNNINNINNI